MPDPIDPNTPVPEPWREAMREFAEEVSGPIKASLDALHVDVKTAIEASKEIGDFYTEQKGKSQLASQAIAEESSQARMVDPFGEPLFASTPKTVQEALGTLGAGGVTPLKPPSQGAGGSRSSSASRGDTPEEIEAAEPAEWEQMLEKPVSMPQHYGGKYTAQDLLRIIGKGAKWRGAEGTAEMFGKAAAIQPTLLAGLNIPRTYASAASEKMEGLGGYASALGYQPGQPGGSLFSQNAMSVGPFNFRPPWASMNVYGLGQYAKNAWEAQQIPGASTAQVAGMYQSLAERGWYPGQSQTHSLFDVQSQLLGRGGAFQELSENPEVMEMLDKATRAGTRSMGEFQHTIEEIPSAAESAHEGIAAFVGTMKSFGEFSEERGGVSAAGNEQAIELAKTTGLPAMTALGFMKSPWAQSMMFRETGQPPWLQGTLPTSTQNRAGNAAFFEAAKMIGRPSAIKTKGFMGFEESTSGLKQQAAQMKKFFFPEMSQEAIEQRLRIGRTGVEGRQKAEQGIKGWQHTAEGMLAHPGKFSEEETKAYVSGIDKSGTKNLGDVLHHLAGLTTTKEGEVVPMFSHEDIHDIRSAGKGKRGQERIQAVAEEAQEIFATKARKQTKGAGEPGSVMIELSPTARKFFQLPNKQKTMKLKAGAGEGSTVNGYAGYTEGPPPAGTTMGNQVMGPSGNFYGR